MKADHSARLLTRLMLTRKPFVYARYGDGDLYCYFDKPPYGTGEPDSDGVQATPILNEHIRRATEEFSRADQPIFIGDFGGRGSGKVGLSKEWEQVKDVLGDRVRYIHVEALLAHRLSQDLLDFYATAADDPRPSVYLAPERLAEGAEFLRAEHLVIPQREAHEFIEEYIDTLIFGPWQVAYFSAGRATKPIMAHVSRNRPDMTLIDLGSALDALFVGRTRSGQVEPDEARRYFALSE